MCFESSIYVCHRLSCFLDLAEVWGVRLIFCGVVGECTCKERPPLLSLPLGLKMAVNSGTWENPGSFVRLWALTSLSYMAFITHYLYYSSPLPVAPNTTFSMVVRLLTFWLYSLFFGDLIWSCGGTLVKNLPANAGDAGWIPRSGGSPGAGNGNPLHYSCLGSPMDREVWQAAVHRVEKS